MTCRILTGVGAIALAAAFFTETSVSGQARAAAPKTDATTPPSKSWTPARTPWGDPDLQGIWSSDDTIGIPIQRPDQYGDRLFLTDQELAEKATREEQARQRSLQERTAPAPAGGAVGPPDHWGERPTRALRQTSLIVEPADGKIPTVTPEAQKRAAGRDLGSFGRGPFNGPEDFTNFDRCITRSVIGSFIARPYGNGFQVVQSPGYLTITPEMIHETRVIPLDGRPHIGAGIRQYMGDSRGRWEGQTLVVETTNFTDRTSIGNNGNGLRHSEAMRLIERFTRVDADTIQYEVALDDPKTYTKPWKMAFPFTTQPGYQVYEYACHEGNYGLKHILSAARADETPSN
jgi:hypothetical protein